MIKIEESDVSEEHHQDIVTPAITHPQPFLSLIINYFHNPAFETDTLR
jgi:hypothetical protein